MTVEEAAKIKKALFDAKNVGDHALSAALVQHLVEQQWRAGDIAPDVLTVAIQLYEAGGHYDRAIDLYQQNREADNANARHLTSVLRVVKTALVAEAAAAKRGSHWHTHTLRTNSAAAAAEASTASISDADAGLPADQLQMRLQQAFDFYNDAIYTETFLASSSEPVEGAKHSVIVTSALLAVVRACPSELLALNPGVLEQCLSIVLALNQPEEEDEEGAGAGADADDDDAVPLLVQPHLGLYSQLMLIAGKAGLFPVAQQLFENMVTDAELVRASLLPSCRPSLLPRRASPILILHTNSPLHSLTNTHTGTERGVRTSAAYGGGGVRGVRGSQGYLLRSLCSERQRQC